MKPVNEKLILTLPYPLALSLAEETFSTNDDLKIAAREGAKDFTLRIADRQLAGKGRNNRSFYSENGLYMSLLLPAREETFSLITPMAAVAVANAVRSLTKEDARIKWVNDVYVGGKKICGILSESVMVQGSRRVVLGIGVNLNTPEEAFPEEIRSIAGSVKADRSELAAAVVDAFLSRFLSSDLGAVKQEYRELSFLTGKEVVVQKENDRREATVLGLTEDLALSVRYADGTEEDLIAGDVSLRLSGKAR